MGLGVYCQDFITKIQDLHEVIYDIYSKIKWTVELAFIECPLE